MLHLGRGRLMRLCVRGLVTLLLSAFIAPLATATALLPNDILVTGTGTVGSGLIRIDRETGAQSLISAGGYGDFQVVGQTVYAASGNSIVAIDAGSGSVETIATGGLLDSVRARGLAVAPNGDVYFAGDGIAKIDAVTRQ